MVCLEGNVLGKLKLPVVFPLKDCFCFYLDVFTENWERRRSRAPYVPRGGHSWRAAQVLEGRFSPHPPIPSHAGRTQPHQ